MATQQEQWHKTKEEEAPVLVIDTGDSLGLLRAVRAQYYARASRVLNKHTDDDDLIDENLLDVVESYRLSGDRVGRLIPEDVIGVEDVKEVISSDQG